MSGFRVHEQSLAWTDRTAWCWPANDRKLVQVFDHVADIDLIMSFVDGLEVCVQAGGACGVWPLRFAQFFERVYTFEPQPINYKCLIENTKGVENITAIHAPLSDERGRYRIHNDIDERENYGAGYIVPDANGLEAVKIDDFQLAACDLIQLDVEGFELAALRGAAETIEQFRPVIVLEEKPLNHVRRDPAEARLWLQDTFGYKQVAAIHRDVILAC